MIALPPWWLPWVLTAILLLLTLTARIAVRFGERRERTYVGLYLELVRRDLLNEAGDEWFPAN